MTSTIGINFGVGGSKLSNAFVSVATSVQESDQKTALPHESDQNLGSQSSQSYAKTKVTELLASKQPVAASNLRSAGPKPELTDADRAVIKALVTEEKLNGESHMYGPPPRVV